MKTKFTFKFLALFAVFLWPLTQLNAQNANAGTDQTICTNNTILNGNAPGTGTIGVWSTIGNAIITDPTLYNTMVTNLDPGANTFTWTFTGNNNTTDNVIITNNSVTSAFAGEYLTEYCDDYEFLNATTPIVGETAHWTIVQGSGTISNTTDAYATFTNMGYGLNKLTWTISKGSCTSVDTAFLDYTAPYTVYAGADQDVCSDNFTMNATQPTKGTGYWSIASGSGMFADFSLYNTGISKLSSGIDTLVWNVTNKSCTKRDTVVINSHQFTAYAGIDNSICTDSLQLNADNPSPNWGSWSIISGSGTFVNPSLEYSMVNNLAPGLNKLKWSVTDGICTQSDTVFITNNTPSTAVAGSDQTVCINNTTLSAINPINGTGVWSIVGAGAGQIIANPNLYNSNISNLVSGINSLEWRVNNNGCTSADTMQINYTPLYANAGPDTSYCADSAQLNANYPSPDVGSWSVITGNGNFAYTGSEITMVNNLANGANTFRWTVSNGSCSVFDDVVITNNLPSGAYAGIDQTVCTSTTNLSASSPTFGIGTWTSLSAGPTFSNFSLNTSSVSNLVSGINNFEWKIDNNGCTSADTVKITYLPVTVNAGPDSSLCSSSITLSANDPSPNNGTWSFVSGNASFVDVNLYNTQASSLSQGVNTLRWTVNNGSCSTYDDVIITNNTPSTANAGLDKTACAANDSLNGNIPTNGMGSWSVITGTAILSNSAINNPAISNLNNGVNTFEWKIDNNGCASSDQINITFNPIVANAGADISVCADSTQLNATNPSPNTGSWSIAAGIGTFTNPALYNTKVTSLALGVNDLLWTVSDGTCAAYDNVLVTNNTPSLANAGVDKTVCAATDSLNGNIPTSGVGMWSVVAGTATLSNAAINNPTISNLTSGVNTFEWKIDNNGCASSDQVSITFNPIVANAGADISVCADSTQLNATNPSPNTGSWSITSGSGVFNNPVIFNPKVSSLALGVNDLLWTVSDGTCAAYDNVLVTNNTPTLANAGSDKTVCDATDNLNGNIPTSGIGAWSTIVGSATINNGAINNTSVSNLNIGVNTFEWKIDNNGCTSTDQVNITFIPIVANAGSDQTTCKSSAFLSATKEAGTTGYWYTSGFAYITNIDSAKTEVSNLDTTSNVFIWQVTNGLCTQSDTVIVNFTPINSSFTQTITNSDVSFSYIGGNEADKAFYWNFDDGGSAQVPYPQHTYAQNGVYHVSLSVNDTLKACQSTTIHKIEIGSIVCDADFSYDTLGLQVSFTDLSQGSPQVWNWDFGDGNKSSLQNPTHTYSASGKYTVSLTIFDPATNCIDTKEMEIKVGTVPCEADFNVFVNSTNKTVELNNLSKGDINAYFWDFGDKQFANSRDTFHTYNNDDFYTICLTVFNTNSGCQNKICKDVQIGENEVSADFSFLSSSDSLNASFQDASTGKITDWYWIFGDGTAAKGQNQSHTYKKAGIYNVRLQVLDQKSGKQSSMTQQIEVGQVQCNTKADFSYYYDSDSDKVYFNDLSVGNISNWSWQFGDGTSSSESSPAHQYAQGGYYLVGLSVKDATGKCFDSKYEFIQIGKVECLADFSYTVEPDSLRVTCLDKSSGNVQKYYWEFGDGWSSTEASPSYTYKKAGRYPVFMSVADTNGLCADFKIDFIQVGDINCDAQFDYFADNSTQNVNFTSDIIGEVNQYRWTFGDGAISSEINPEHHYDYKGYYNVQLITFNTENNCASSFRKTILVGDQGDDCEADFFYQSDDTTRNVIFTDNSKGENLSYVWDFGDNSTTETSSPNHTYVDPGTKYVCLTVTNAKGISNMSCKNVKVGKSCEARFDYGVDSLTKTVTFTDQSLGTPTNWKWKFGDNTEATDQNPSHTYSQNGDYAVFFEISDGKDCKNSDIQIVSVGTTNDTAFVADFVMVVDTTATKPKRPVEMYGTGKGDSPKPSWNFGDAQKRGYAVNATTLRPTYYYPDVDTTYTICLTIEDPITGKSGQKCHTLTLQGSSSIANKESDIKLSFYPNPAQDYIQLQYSLLNNSKLSIIIYDLAGNKVKTVMDKKQLTGNYKMQVPISRISAGSYYIELRSKNSKIVKKLIISK